MKRLWIVLLVACSSPSKPAPVAKPADAATVEPIFEAPEPKPPEIECSFSQSEFCVAGPKCAATQPARHPDPSIKLEAQYSTAKTRAKRATDPTACCYIEFSTEACD